MKFNLSSKLFLISFLILFGAFLLSTQTNGQCSFSSNPACGSHYGKICCPPKGACSLVERTVCLPWQTGEIKTYCSQEACVTVFLGCNLSNSCIEPPLNLRYYDNPKYPTDPLSPEKGIGADNIFLPVKLDWDDVKGWKDGWLEEGKIKTCLSRVSAGGAVTKGECEKKCDEIGPVSLLGCGGGGCDQEVALWNRDRCSCMPEYWRAQCKSECPNKCANSFNFYQIKINGDLKGYEGSKEYKAFIGKSEFIPPSCFLKPNRTYQWQARACIEENEQKCGPWSELKTFKTNLTPEHISPDDPDWSDKEGGKNIALPVTLDWCDVQDANSFQLKVYIMKGGEKTCHPNLLTIREGQEFCDPWIIRKQRRDIQQVERILYSDLPDEELYFFTYDTTYSWEAASCLDDNGQDCRDFSKPWTFTTNIGGLPQEFLTGPPNDPQGQNPVGFPVILDWRKDAGINSWWYKIGSAQELAQTSQSRSFDYPELSLNTSYQWQVLSCLDYEGENCPDSWSEIYTFKTTGQPPNLIYPPAGAVNVPIPVNFDWGDVPGVKSYVINVRGNNLSVEKILDESDFVIDYPEFPIRQEADYTWQVKTCARENGQVCGAYSSLQNFKTFRISPPQNPTYPQNEGMLFTDEHFISWEKVEGAKAYQYQIKYLSLDEKEINETCPPLVGKEIFKQPQTILINSGSAELPCLGKYQWQVRSCFDENCQETSNLSNPWIFNLVEGGIEQGGLVPCGRRNDNLETSWNEREPCQIKHLFLSLKIILDFILFRAIPIVLILLTLATGVIFFTSLGKAITMAQIMSLWKSAGIGLTLVFFAWMIVNIFLGLVGYNISVFGKWYDINL